MRIFQTCLIPFLIGLMSPAFAGPKIENVKFLHVPPSTRTTYYGEVVLPAGEGYRTVHGPPGPVLFSAYLLPAGSTRQGGRGRRRQDPTAGADTLRHVLLATRSASAKGPISLTLEGELSGERLSFDWDISGATADAATVRSALETARRWAWRPYASVSGSPVLQSWMGANGGPSGSMAAMGPRGRGRMGSAFSMLGGRAAVRETLQMRLLSPSTERGEGPGIPLASVEGVQVPAHPFREMLAGAEGGRLDLARVVPHDRFFVHVARPEALLPFLDDGTRFISRLGAGVTGNALDYDLTGRYLARLGLREDWLRTFLASGAVSEMALSAPDLFFIDGTEVTVVSRLRNPKLLAGLLRLIGVQGLSPSGRVVRAPVEGSTAFWALRDDLLFLSTSEAELSAGLALAEKEGKGGLGASAEFRYMLTQLPVDQGTRMYAYLSDPFIRRLVGPAVKIGQLRRMKARADMERIAAAGLLAGMDGVPVPDLDTLIRRGYLPEGYGSGDYRLTGDLHVESTRHGPLNALKPISGIPMETVTTAEADAYRAYLEGYERFWRRYFDPIAIRFGDTPDGGLAMETFILPLIDNTLYTSLRGGLASAESDAPLAIPTLDPEPVVMFSMNFQKEAWHEGVETFFNDLLGRYSTIDPSVVADLLPRLHLAVHDADPVVALGSGDILGAFNGRMITRGSEMMFAPILLSILTRPCTLLVETANPERTARFLSRASTTHAHRRNRGTWVGPSDFYALEGRNAWVYALEIMGVVKLRYGIEVRGNHVLIRNIPWADDVTVTGTTTASLNGARLSAHPEATRLGIPALATAAGEQAREAAMESLGMLYPLVAGGWASPVEAPEAHRRLFGFRPLHPGSGEWEWKDGRLGSAVYGTVFHQKQPASPGAAAALLHGIEDLSVEMQFESDGLRTLVRWRVPDK